MGDALVELAVEVEDLVGQAKAQMVWRKHMIVLRQNRHVVFPGGFRAAAELRRMQQEDAWLAALVLDARLEIVRGDVVDGDRAALHGGSYSAAMGRSSGLVPARSLIAG